VGWIMIPVVAVIAVLIFILEIVLVLVDDQGRRMGDRIAGTMVIVTDD
jgi:hypothetical protein